MWPKVVPLAPERQNKSSVICTSLLSGKVGLSLLPHLLGHALCSCYLCLISRCSLPRATHVLATSLPRWLLTNACVSRSFTDSDVFIYEGERTIIFLFDTTLDYENCEIEAIKTFCTSLSLSSWRSSLMFVPARLTTTIIEPLRDKYRFIVAKNHSYIISKLFMLDINNSLKRISINYVILNSDNTYTNKINANILFQVLNKIL